MTFPLSFPDIPISSSQFYLASNPTVFAADLPATETIAALDDKTDRWEGKYVTPQLSEDQHRLFTAWILSMQGRIGTFLAFDPDRKEPATKNGGFPGNGLVNGAGQTGNALATDGWPVSSLILKAGDLVQVESQLFEIASDVTSDASGNATLQFQPAMRVSPADDVQVVTSNPVMTARLKEPDIMWLTDFSRTGALTITFEETL